MSSLLYGKAFKGLRKVSKRVLSACYPLVKQVYRFPKVKSIDDTIDHLLENRASISRYGDSEFLFIIDRISLPYQVFDEMLRQRMIDILVSNHPNHTVGLPIGYQSLENLIPDSKLFWRSQVVWTYPRLRKFLDLNKEYLNASMTRIYVTFDDKRDCPRIFAKLMSLWQGRNVLLIEGEKSRLGVGNDLFSRANRVDRVLAPQHHAFGRYADILKEARKYPKDTLVLMALGPTATVLAYDLAREGYQALDIGNVDIEYEWFLRGATSKVKIPGKYTSEAIGGRVVDDIVDELYESQVVARIL
jgi:glycosyltransferase family protein